MDTDLELIWSHFRHIFPEFTCNHLHVYRLLWRIEPKNPEFLIEESKLSRATVYKALNDLLSVGLIKKTGLKPVCYYAEEPLKTYDYFSQKIFSKLKSGKKQIQKILNNATGLSGEFYLIQRDGGQMRLVNKQTRQTVLDDYAEQVKKTIEIQVKEETQKKLKPWQLIGR